MTATHFLGSDGIITVAGDVKAGITDFSIDISVDTIASARVGQKSDKQYPGKVGITGTLNEVLITPELLSFVVGDSNTLTTSSAEALLTATDLDAAAREELTITPNPTDPTSVKVTLTVGDAVTTAGSVVVHGTDVSGNYVTEVIDFAAMAVGDPAQVVYGSQQFNTTTFVDVEAALESGTPGNYSTLKIDGITGVKTMTPGDATLFTIIGKVIDPDSNYAQITLDNCFFTSGNFPIGDANTLVACDLPFICQDPDSDMSLVWTST